jgi:hypothetical protein
MSPARPVVVVAIALAACAPPPQRKPLEMEPIGTVANVPRTADDDTAKGGTTTPNAATPAPPASGGGGGGSCSSGDFESLDETLRQCEAPMPKSAELPSGMKDKLEVRVTASTTSITPGGRVDLTVVFRNKSNEALPLFFTGDPNPRFEVEAQDTKGKRVDLPAGKQPAWPKGTGPQIREVKASKIVVDKGGTARVRIPWDAVKMKWAPEKAKVWEGRGFPRSPAGPLPNGKYNLVVKLPVLGIYEQNVDIPKIAVDVGG